jgi:DNA-binding GntR family transcriptional regulator
VISPTSESGARNGSALRSVASANSAVDRVTAEIRRAVLYGTLAPGESFSISDLSAQLGVSHIPVREALRQLHSQGLIVMRPGRTAIVAPLNRQELQSIYRLRQLIEPDLASRSVTLFTEGDLQLLEQLLNEYCKVLMDADEFWSSHHDLHEALIRPAASEWDMRLLEQLWHASDRYTRVVFDAQLMTKPEREHRFERHRRLLEAARSGEPDELRLAVGEHLTENEAVCLDRFAALSESVEGIHASTSD